MHDTSKSIPTILAGYPRGQRELNGLYHKRFTPAMAREWFEGRGVELKVEDDGRMFPVTDSSLTIMDTLMGAANQAGVEIRLRQKVTDIEQQSTTVSSIGDEKIENCFTVHYKDGSTEDFGAVILATGSSPAGYALVKSLGHDPLISQVPSLFTLNCKHAVSEGGILFGLAGVSVPLAHLSVTIPSDTKNENDDQEASNSKKKPKRKKGKALVQEGPLLITHHGISGPATLKLSAFGAREFHGMNYRGYVAINWDRKALGSNAEHVFDELWKVTSSNPKRKVASTCPVQGNSIPRRLWSAIVLASGFTEDSTWGMAPKKLVRELATNLVAYPLEFTGKGTFKEEFVTAGGVDLKDINMKTMQSKIVPGLYFCGELINVDGVTGGYNFMNCWSTGYVAGESSVEQLLERIKESKGADWKHEKKAS
jgi:predicted flavoprotein YhiN